MSSSARKREGDAQGYNKIPASKRLACVIANLWFNICCTYIYVQCDPERCGIHSPWVGSYGLVCAISQPASHPSTSQVRRRTRIGLCDAASEPYMCLWERCLDLLQCLVLANASGCENSRKIRFNTIENNISLNEIQLCCYYEVNNYFYCNHKQRTYHPNFPIILYHFERLQSEKDTRSIFRRR